MNPRYLTLLVLLLTAAEAQQPLKIAEHVASRADVDRTLTIHEPGATFIKVHFADVRSPLKVSSPDRSQQYVYTPGHYKQMTRHGEHVAALSIEGDTAVVELLGRGRVTVLGWDKGWNEQQIEANNPQPEIFCGADDSRPIECYQDSEPQIYERSRPVAKLILPTGGMCTAWRVGPGNRMMTNNHCMDLPETIAGSELWFDYKYTTCTGTTLNAAFKVPGDQLLVTSSPYDFTLFTVPDSPALQAHGWFGLDVSLPEQDERLYINNHLRGRPLLGLVSSDRNASGLCQVDVPSYNGRAPDSDFGYYCDSDGGQSGAPVSNFANHRAFGIHHFGNVGGSSACLNGAVKMANIWPILSPFFDGVVPLGDNEAEVDRPQAVPAVSCVDNVCQYSREGSIGDSFLWNFGDGTYSEEAAGTHTYSSPGNILVTLYATMNGVTDSQSVLVHVVVPGWNEPPNSRFEYTVDGLTVQFRSTSEDVDGQVVQWAWRIRDPLDNVLHTYTAETVTHTFAGGGADKYVDLTTTDNGGKRGNTFYQYIDLPTPPPEPVCGDGACNGDETHATCPADCPAPPIKLTYTARRVGGPNWDVTLTWTGAAGDTVMIFRAGKSGLSPNDGSEVYRLHNREKGTAFKVCDATRCSAAVTATW